MNYLRICKQQYWNSYSNKTLINQYFTKCGYGYQEHLQGNSKIHDEKPSTGSIGPDTITSTIFNHSELFNNGKDIYLDKCNPQIIVDGNIMKLFNTGIPDPSDIIGITMMTQEYHPEPPFTGDCMFTRDGTYFQLIKQDSARDKHFLSNMTSCHGSPTTYIRICYQSINIQYATYESYVHSYYCFRPEENYSKR